ncbi:ADP compounds hydrolase NudE [Testudinibacter sp. TR-2022]|uniref:ADP compounds hydrolase NudE n=1 Tax=Testudinibacter sp. TR-2022 TaxID=2585029 RepID=UPI001119745D|nr:ADP compounds hydrolase NudE [Testudinibacter sp. TR-2022]TNH08847.1 ADP compounds hydrolase NudE [Pasteurellaceae bacterium Phil11]TNH25893.1 ADP compounds hydrolase NudE [Testudinibacter sp. TR-2022]TNH28472.1 ADP compounds hydrolase NudE [Testudinibacter sp. TR-2022]
MCETRQKPKILSLSVAAKSKIFEIQAVDLEFANGERRTFERFKPSQRSAVLVMAIHQDNLLLVREYAVGTERYELGFAKGLMDPGETPQQSANRELQEEIGFKADKLTLLRTVITSPGFMHNPMHIFLAEQLTPSCLVGDEPEPLELVAYPLSELDQLLSQQDFCEARNLTALYLLRDHLAAQSEA